jgi:hypothetical protein
MNRIIIAVVLFLITVIKCFSQELEDKRIKIIKDFLYTLSTKKTNSDVILQYCTVDNYFKNDTIRKIADEWIEHVKSATKNKETFIIRKYDLRRGKIEFGLVNITTRQVESIIPDDIYEFLSDNKPGILYLYFNSSNKIISFSAFNINNKVAFIPY